MLQLQLTLSLLLLLGNLSWAEQGPKAPKSPKPQGWQCPKATELSQRWPMARGGQCWPPLGTFSTAPNILVREDLAVSSHQLLQRTKARGRKSTVIICVKSSSPLSPHQLNSPWVELQKRFLF